MVRHLPSRPLDLAEVEAAYVDLADRRALDRPYVAVNMVASADGAVSVEGRSGGLGSSTDWHVFQYLRSLADVILVGAQTVRAEGYGPPQVSEARQQRRLARGQSALPRIAVVTGSLDLDWSSALFQSSVSRPIVLTAGQADSTRREVASEVADVVVTGNDRVDIGAALRSLDVGLVLCEGGPTLNGELARLDLVDELCLTVAPTLVGGDVGGAGLLGRVHLGELLPMDIVHALEDEGELLLRYRRRRGPAPTAAEARAVTAPSEGLPSEAIEAFHAVVADLDYPMLVVTASRREHLSGCLVGFAAQASIHPPRFAVWLSKHNHTFSVASTADVLAVHLLAAGQGSLAELFGSQTGDEVDKFAACSWHRGPENSVVLDDVARWFVGRVVETLDSGDHVAFLLEPIAATTGDWPGQLGFQAVKDLSPGHPA